MGAGPAGATLAHLLATRGIAVTLLERQSDFAREFRGEVLAPSGAAVLEALKLGPALDAVPQRTPTALNLFVDRSKIFGAEFSTEMLEGPAPRIFSQPALLEAIVADAQARSALSFHRGSSVKELLREDGRIVGVRARTDQGEQHLLADLVIGCDGRASVVRRLAPLEVEREELPMDVVWCKLPAPPEMAGSCPVNFCIGGSHLFISYISYDGLLQVAWVILKGSFGELRQRGVEDWVGEMADYAPPALSPHLRANAGQFVHPFLLDTCADCVKSWSVPGAMVLGDAAHTMSPVGAQGLNIALRDAVVAANHLVPLLQQGAGRGELDAAAARIEAERMPEVAQIQAMQALPPRVVLRDVWWAEVLRQVPKLLRYAPVRALASRGARPFMFGKTDVSLRV